LKLGFSAWAMRELAVDRQIEIVREAGYASICLVSDPRFPQLDALTVDAAERRRIRQLVDSAGLELSAIAGHANLLEPGNRERLEAGIDLAADLGAPCVICMGYGSPERYEQVRETLAHEFGELARYAEPRGVVVALEPHVGQAFDLPEKVVWLMQAVGSPHFRLNLDNSHFEVMGRDLADYLPLLVPYAVHTDLKDQRGRYPDHEFLVPGEGSFSYARYLSAMQAAGYSGCSTIEISVMVQKRPDYDPAEVARRSFATLVAAERESGVSLVHGVKT
jgi:sugar phosphate isomerase/epimerase